MSQLHLQVMGRLVGVSHSRLLLCVLGLIAFEVTRAEASPYARYEKSFQQLQAEAVVRAVDDYAVGVAPPLSRSWTDGGPSLDYSLSMSLGLARAESELREIIIIPMGFEGVDGVQLSMEEISGVTGSAPVVSLGPVGYVSVDYNRPSTMQYGMFDVMLPQSSQVFNCAANQLQSVYLLVETSAQTAPGQYLRRIKIQPAGKSPVFIDVTIRVWDFVLSQTPPLKGWVHTLSPDLMVDHKLEAGWWSPPISDIYHTITSNEWDLIRASIVRWFDDGHNTLMVTTPGSGLNGRLIGGAGNGDAPAYTLEQIAYMKDYWRGVASILDARNQLHLAAVYVWDEPHFDRFGEMAEICDWVHSANARLRTCAAGWGDLRSYRDNGIIDVYSPATFLYDSSLDRPGAAMSAETWWYVMDLPNWAQAPGGQRTFPNLMADNPPLEQRMFGWQSYSFGATGFIYWETALSYWDGGNVYSPPSTYSGSVPLYGNGTLVYNMSNSWVPSLRLRHFADGMEDLQYIQMLSEILKIGDLQAKDSNSVEWLRQVAVAESLLDDCRLLAGATISDYDKDPGVFLSKREELAMVIVDLMQLMR